MYNFSNVESNNIPTNATTAVLGYIQSILIGLPFFIVIVCVLKKVALHVKSLCQRKSKKQEKGEQVEEEELPARMLYNMDDLDSSSSYQLIK